MNSATIIQCHEILDELEELRGLVDAESLREEYNDRIHESAFHFRVYADYPSNSEKYASYASYIEHHRPESTPG